VGSNGRVKDAFSVLLQGGERTRLVGRHQPRVADNVGCEDRRQFPVDAFSSHQCVRACGKWLVPLRSALFRKIHILRPWRDRLYPWPAVASKERRPQPEWVTSPRAASARGRIGRGTKANVEVAVQVAMRLIVPKLRNQQFFSLWELNAAIAPLVAQINNCVSHHLGASRHAPRPLWSTMY
jgi:hypothetical protein